MSNLIEILLDSQTEQERAKTEKDCQTMIENCEKTVIDAVVTYSIAECISNNVINFVLAYPETETSVRKFSSTFVLSNFGDLDALAEREVIARSENHIEKKFQNSRAVLTLVRI